MKLELLNPMVPRVFIIVCKNNVYDLRNPRQETAKNSRDRVFVALRVWDSSWYDARSARGSSSQLRTQWGKMHARVLTSCTINPPVFWARKTIGTSYEDRSIHFLSSATMRSWPTEEIRVALGNPYKKTAALGGRMLASQHIPCVMVHECNWYLPSPCTTTILAKIAVSMVLHVVRYQYWLNIRFLRVAQVNWTLRFFFKQSLSSSNHSKNKWSPAGDNHGGLWMDRRQPPMSKGRVESFRDNVSAATNCSPYAKHNRKREKKA